MSRLYKVTIEEEIASPDNRIKPHVVLLGAGASRAALPNGDRCGRRVPLLREVAAELNLLTLFPKDLQETAVSDFEAAYSSLVDSDGGAEPAREIESEVARYFAELELPTEPTIYDALVLSLREKDAIFTFNWDPFLIEAKVRLGELGVTSLPKLFFLHGNVALGYCLKDRYKGMMGERCPKCHKRFEQSRLLFPVARKNYTDGGIIEHEWAAVQDYLRCCFMLTIFGYGAPRTDVEASQLLKSAWGPQAKRNMEQIEIICRPDADKDGLRKTWNEFIHTHHYEIHGSYWDSILGNHPRRSVETCRNWYIDAKFTNNNKVPVGGLSFLQLIAWHKPLFDAEAGDATPPQVVLRDRRPGNSSRPVAVSVFSGAGWATPSQWFL